MPTLYLVRHARAEARGAAWPDDGERPLSKSGVLRARLTGDGLRRLGVAIDLVLTSPCRRSMQTAESLAERLERHPPVVLLPALAPGRSTREVLADLVVQRRHAERVALVGHEPMMSELAGEIARLGSVDFRKGAVCRIDLDGWAPPRGRLRWFLTSKILRELRG